MKRIALAICLFSYSPAFADETIRTPDGRQILLKTDGTYEVIATPETPSSRSYTKISITDLKLDINDMSGEWVEVRGELSSFGSAHVLSHPDQADATPLSMEAADLSRDDRKYLLQNCNPRCHITVRGEISKVVFGPGIHLHMIVR